VDGVPVQLFRLGVTLIVADIGLAPVLVAVKDAIFPVPLADSPIAVLELVHVNVPPAGVLVKFVADTVPLVQTVISEGTLTVGIALIVIIAVSLVAAQPPAAAMLLVTV